jgi:hypothetical protein
MSLVRVQSPPPTHLRCGQTTWLPLMGQLGGKKCKAVGVALPMYSVPAQVDASGRPLCLVCRQPTAFDPRAPGHCGRPSGHDPSRSTSAADVGRLMEPRAAAAAAAAVAAGIVCTAAGPGADVVLRPRQLSPPRSPSQAVSGVSAQASTPSRGGVREGPEARERTSPQRTSKAVEADTAATMKTAAMVGAAPTVVAFHELFCCGDCLRNYTLRTR